MDKLKHVPLDVKPGISPPLTSSFLQAQNHRRLICLEQGR